MTEAMGHGVNQRKAIQMTPDEVDAFLAERRPMTMCSLSRDGSIHAVAMWYGFLDGCVTVETKAKSQKVQNLRRDPRLTLLFEDGDYYEELRGVELVGRAEIVDDPDKLWDARCQRVRALRRPVLRRAQAVRRGDAAQAGGGQDARGAHRELGPPQARAAADRARALREDLRPPAGRRAAGAGVAAYGSPAFYQGRPDRDDIAVVEVVRHDDSGARMHIEVRFAFTGSVSSAVRAVIDPAKMSWVTRTEVDLDEARTVWEVLPDHYPDRLDRERGLPLRTGPGRAGKHRRHRRGRAEGARAHRRPLGRAGHRLGPARVHRGGGHEHSGPRGVRLRLPAAGQP